MSNELTKECEVYDTFLREVQTSEMIFLQNSFDTTRTEKVLEPLHPDINSY